MILGLQKASSIFNLSFPLHTPLEAMSIDQLKQRQRKDYVFWQEYRTRWSVICISFIADHAHFEQVR